MILLDTLTLPSGLAWPDEFSGDTPVAQTVARRLDGGLAVYPRAQAGGRSITLVATDDHPLTRAQGATLAVLAAVPGATYALSLTDRGIAAQVMFRHHDAPALELTPLVDYQDPLPTDRLVGTIKLMTV